MSDTRKVQKVGGGTYTVSIPKAWANDHGLEAGTEVTLSTYGDGSLVVRAPPTDDKLAETCIEIADDGPVTVERALAAAYAAGFEAVRITGDSSAAEPHESLTTEQRRAVRRFVRERAGVEVVEETESTLVARSIFGAGDVSIQQSTVQLNFVALSMHRTATAAITDEDDGGERRISERVSDARRHVAMIRRHLHRVLVDIDEAERLDIDRVALFEYYCAARHLERVAEQAVRLDSLADENSLPDDIAREVSEMATNARSVVKDATAVLLGGSPAKVAHDALDQRDQIRTDVPVVETALEARTDRDAIRAIRTLDCLLHTADTGAEIAKIALGARLRMGDVQQSSLDNRPPTA